MNKLIALVTLSAVAAVGFHASASAEVVCTAIADVQSGRVLRQDGDCARKTGPESTFKIAISLMGFDAGVLKDEHTPSLPFREGYVDWVPAWRATTDPTYWMKNSVVWYSQQTTLKLGMERFKAYVTAFNYGNADVSGDPGKNNGLTRSWLNSSLKISPLAQLQFLRKVVLRRLPVSAHAYEMTERLTSYGEQGDGWMINGKTGTSESVRDPADASKVRSHGWFVGWARRGERSFVFARLIQDEKRMQPGPGARARDAMLKDLPKMLSGL